MPFHDKVADFLDDVIPNEIKPYLGTVAATAVPAYFNIPGGAFGDFLAGGGTDILMQKLLYGSDEDRDTDYLSAGMSGILGALAGMNPQTTREVNLEKAGIQRSPTFGQEALGEKEYIAAMRNQGFTNISPADYQNYAANFGGPEFRGIAGADTNLKLLDRLNVGTAVEGEGGFMNVLKSDVARGLKDFATPFGSDGQFFGNLAGSDTPLLDIGGELLSTATLAQVGQTPSQVRDAAKALEAAEREYENYLATLDAENRARIEDDINARIEAHKRFMTLAGFTEAEIDDALITGGYLSSGETAYAAQGGRIGFATGSGNEDDRDEIAFNLFGKPYVELDLDEREELKEEMIRLRHKSATGGRVGFDNGGDTGGMTDRMGLGNYMEAEKVRTEFMDKMKRGLQAAEMNMKLNDPGLMRFINALPFMGEGFYTREEMRFPSMKERYEANIEKMKRDQARDDYEKRQLQKQLRKENFDMMVDMVDDRFSDNREQRKMAKKGGRMTPQGDPISPDVPNGMQMDLRGGGFIPLGTKPKADDVPAMVGLNEFVLNDEAVSGIGKLITGKPDPRAGARALYQLQDQMEAIV
jgi:hypothetical protein